ncbi:MAG: zinc-dependent metalloprotease [Saprospiraceae bacterium]
MKNVYRLSFGIIAILIVACSTTKRATPGQSATAQTMAATSNSKPGMTTVITTKTDSVKPKSDSSKTAAKSETPKNGPKPFNEVITSKAVSKTGMFTVHKVEDKYYFELPFSMLGKEIMAITRFVRTPTSAGYGGELVNRQMIRFEKGTEQKVFLRAQALVNVSTDTTAPIYKAVLNSNVNPIAAAFDIKAIRKDTSLLIDITDFFNGDAQVIGFNSNIKSLYRLGGLQADRSYIQSIKPFPINIEVKTVKTFAVTPPPNGPTPPGAPQSVTLPGALASGFATMELNTSLILLPEIPMKKRLFDPRVGYFSTGYTVYNEGGQRTENPTFAVRWRLEPKNEADAMKQKNGELIEPAKPIVYYIDPATPKKWRKYLIMGVNDWQVAFEQAGWKNAIRAEEFPENDSTISLEDARYSAIRYFASPIENAYGPNINDPRTGEILESHIGWYHNVMKLLQKWYRTQAGAVDPRAQKNEFDDELMGSLVRFVSSHEVGHTLGLRHNYGASSATPVEKLRDKDFIKANGHTSSIMDYARFNYVAQPEDGVTDLYPRIGDYDKWAIEWGYKPIYNTKDEKEDLLVLNKWFKEKAYPNRRLWFLTEVNPYDPRAQNEDIGDNAMVASEYGIKNLKRIVVNLPTWTKDDGQDYDMLKEAYESVIDQFRRYMGHVVKNIGGIYETPKTYDQNSPVYEPTPANMQRDAVKFLSRNLFTTPSWLIDPAILNKIQPGQGIENIRALQEPVINGLFNEDRLQRMIETESRFPNTYKVMELFSDLQSAVWNDLAGAKEIDVFRRDLQKVYVERLITMLKTPAGPSNEVAFFGTVIPGRTDPKKNDVLSLVRGHLKGLRLVIDSAKARRGSNTISSMHLDDLSARIKEALDPKS